MGNFSHLWEVAEIVNNDSKDVLSENDQEKRVLDKQSLSWYKKRIYEKLDDYTKISIIETAKKDVENILNAMSPVKEQIKLYRNVRIKDIVPVCKVGEVVSFKIISSTSIIPSEQNQDFYRYEIIVPKNTPILELDQFSEVVRNENGEVLLPPMKCKVSNIIEGKGYCKKVIVFQIQ